MPQIFGRAIEGVVEKVQGTVFLPVLFTVVILLFTAMSAVYIYHWKKYSLDPRVEHTVTVLYFVVAGILILGALISLMAL